ncbi:CLUMA_CG006555, isoform A [Clunio marinus]|uniref:CLUMA_CG006555, isoform A n=1 Tax=Clunio marinus TaxID=568069 RepID=A0A1J1HYI8_9DIPT|nr:CLUMA_CG006555, isoform A [Clunio marinus]
MNKFLIIVSCLAAVTFASPVDDITVEYLANGEMRCRINCNRNRNRNPISPWNDCPPTNCPPPFRPPNCGAPDCSNVANRVRGVHFDHPNDPNRFIVCAPLDAVTWAPKEQWCGCGTVFSSVSDPSKCVHPWDWEPACPSQQNPPVLSTENCGEDCPDCDNGNGGGGNGGDSSEEGDEIPDTTPSPPGNCPCPCICIMWPCQPCASNCQCNGQQPQRPPMNPWDQQPQRPPMRPDNRPNNNPQQPQRPPMRPWDQQPQRPPMRPDNPWEQNPDDTWNRQPNERPDNSWQHRPRQPWNQQQNDHWRQMDATDDEESN